jgi:hypothetical protein
VQYVFRRKIGAGILILRQTADTLTMEIQALQKRMDLRKILDGLDKSTLVSVLLEYSSENQSLKDALLFRFSEKPDTVSYAAKLIETSIKNAMSQGFIRYADTGYAICGAEKVLEMISTNKDVFESAELCHVVLREMIEWKNASPVL